MTLDTGETHIGPYARPIRVSALDSVGTRKADEQCKGRPREEVAAALDELCLSRREVHDKDRKRNNQRNLDQRQDNACGHRILTSLNRHQVIYSHRPASRHRSALGIRV